MFTAPIEDMDTYLEFAQNPYYEESGLNPAIEMEVVYTKTSETWGNIALLL